MRCVRDVGKKERKGGGGFTLYRIVPQDHTTRHEMQRHSSRHDGLISTGSNTRVYAKRSETAKYVCDEQ